MLLFGNSPAYGGDYCIGHATLSDVIDADGVRAALADAGLVVDGLIALDAVRIAAVFAKAEASPTGAIGADVTPCCPMPILTTSAMPAPRLAPLSPASPLIPRFSSPAAPSISAHPARHRSPPSSGFDIP